MTVSIYCNTGFFIEQCSVKQRYGGKVKKDDLSWFTSKSDRMHNLQFTVRHWCRQDQTNCILLRKLKQQNLNIYFWQKICKDDNRGLGQRRITYPHSTGKLERICLKKGSYSRLSSLNFTSLDAKSKFLKLASNWSNSK